MLVDNMVLWVQSLLCSPCNKISFQKVSVDLAWGLGLHLVPLEVSHIDRVVPWWWCGVVVIVVALL